MRASEDAVDRFCQSISLTAVILRLVCAPLTTLGEVSGAACCSWQLEPKETLRNCGE